MGRLRRVRTAGGGKDRLSALPKRVIRLILSRLDTRTALSTAVLARRWARVTRKLPALDLRVSDILPPEYDRTVTLRRRNLPQDMSLAAVLDALMADCELGTMRSFVQGATGFLDADGHGRRAKTLRLEFFQTHDGGVVDRLIAAAVGAWGVTDLEVVVLPASCNANGHAPAYSFPHDSLEDTHRTRLRSLTLGGHCTVPPLASYGALTTLVLKDMPASTPVDVYQSAFSECARLHSLRLVSCRCAAQDRLVVDAPRSELKELVVEDCSFMAIELRALPMLARLACLTNTVELVLGSVPCLTRTNLTFHVDDDVPIAPPRHDRLGQFVGTMSPAMASLVVRFTGRRSTWMYPKRLDKPLHGLKSLLIADLPSNWDVSWIRMLLMDTPSLEVLHIHVAHAEEEPERYGVIWSRKSQEWRHRSIKEIVMAGFTQRHVESFLRHAVGACTSLQRLALLKDGRVRYDGLWDWEMIGQQQCPRSHRDEKVVRRMIKSGPRPLVELILG